MSFKFLITRPEHDDTNHYLSNWSKKLIDLAEQRGAKVLDLNREKANKKDFEGRIKSFK